VPAGPEAKSETLFNVKSVSKSFLSALTGIAIQQGYLTGVDQPIAPFFPEYLGPDLGPPWGDVTVRHLLTHTAGFLWEESGSVHLGWQFSDDWIAYTLGLPFVAEPGSTFNYTTAGTHLLAVVLARATGRPLMDFAQEALFEPGGIEIGRWDTDPQGNYIGGKDMYFRAIDLAIFGVLFIDSGIHDGVTVVPESWVRESTGERIPFGGESGYGYLWCRWAPGRHESYYASGMGGQYIFIVPDLDLVVVITSTLESGWGYHNSVLAFVEGQILPTIVR
jgi:CubicO group peptidase (beta-lactamase class C family)